MNAVNRIPAVAEARRASDVAEERFRKRRGELIAAVGGWRRQLPPAVLKALDAYEAAEDAASFAREQITAVREFAFTPEELTERHRFARISALIASHVVGASLIPGSSRLYPWKMIGADGRTREVPNYAGDAAAIGTAERLLEPTPGIRTRYGFALVALVGTDPAALALASPECRARAMLAAIGVEEYSEPPVRTA